MEKNTSQVHNMEKKVLMHIDKCYGGRGKRLLPINSKELFRMIVNTFKKDYT